MNWNLKKMWPAAAASLIAFTSFANADHHEANGACCPPQPCCPKPCCEEPPCPQGCINPNARPEVKCGWNVYVTGDVLLWQANMLGLDYGISKNTVQQIDEEWTWGFRFGLGYNLCHDGWDVYLAWTHLNHNASHKATCNTTLYPTFITPTYTPSATGGKATWDAELDFVDLELGREFYTSRYLTLRPHIGLRFVRLDQKFNVYYDAASWNDNTNVFYKNSNDYWGIGPRAGFNTQWGLGCGWSIFGDFAISLLWGEFDVSQCNDKCGCEAVYDYTYFNKNSNHVGRAMTDIAVGLRYDHMFCADRYHLGIQLGWEHHMLWGQNQLWQRVNELSMGAHNKSNDEFATQGPTLSFRFDF